MSRDCVHSGEVVCGCTWGVTKRGPEWAENRHPGKKTEELPVSSPTLPILGGGLATRGTSVAVPTAANGTASNETCNMTI